MLAAATFSSLIIREQNPLLPSPEKAMGRRPLEEGRGRRKGSGGGNLKDAIESEILSIVLVKSSQYATIIFGFWVD